MGNIATGLFIMFAVLIITVLVAFIQYGTNSTFDAADCNADYSECEGASQASFLANIIDVSLSGLNGAPTWFNVFYVLITGGSYVIGVILLAFGVISSAFGGG